MKAGLVGAALVATVAVVTVLVWGGFAWPPGSGADSEVDRLEDRFVATAGCGPDGTDRETLESNGFHSWMAGIRQHGPRFARYVERTEPELTVIACKDSGPAVRYFEFANRDRVLGAARAYRDDRRFCVLDNALIDFIGAAGGRNLCDELGGQLR